MGVGLLSWSLQAVCGIWSLLCRVKTGLRLQQMLLLSRCSYVAASVPFLLGCWSHLLIDAALPAGPPVCRRWSCLPAPASGHGDAA